MSGEGSIRPRVVIVGAGFGGLEAAKTLANQAVDVTLIDKKNHHLFQPLLYQVATASLTASEIAAPIRSVLRGGRNIRVFMETVRGVDPESRCVLTESGKTIPYDYLVLSTGAQHSYFGKDEWARFAPGLKSIEDAIALRQRILDAFEQAEMETDPEKRRALLDFVIVGAGPTGVELAGAIAELARHTLKKEFRNYLTKEARIYLVEAGSRVLPAFSECLSAIARRNLAEMGVDVLTNTRVENVEAGLVTLNGQPMHCRTVIWAAGVKASPAGAWIGAETDRSGRVVVSRDLSVKDRPEIFAIGDTACYIQEGGERPLPGIAPVAKQQGRYVGQAILDRVAGRPVSKAFRYRDYGTMATIGRNKAVADLRIMKIHGFSGWLFWCLAHIYFLIGYRSRLIVMMNWLWNYLTHSRGVRLIIGQKEAA